MIVKGPELVDRRGTLPDLLPSLLDVFAILTATAVAAVRGRHERERPLLSVGLHFAQRVCNEWMPVPIAPVDRKVDVTRLELFLERPDEGAVLVVDRALAVEVVVVGGHLLEALRRHVLAAHDILEKRHDVGPLFGTAKRDQKNAVVFQIRVAHGGTLAPKGRGCKSRLLPRNPSCALGDACG